MFPNKIDSMYCGLNRRKNVPNIRYKNTYNHKATLFVASSLICQFKASHKENAQCNRPAARKVVSYYTARDITISRK